MEAHQDPTVAERILTTIQVVPLVSIFVVFVFCCTVPNHSSMYVRILRHELTYGNTYMKLQIASVCSDICCLF